MERLRYDRCLRFSPRYWLPIAIKENIVTERTTDGYSPASIPNKISDVSIINSFIQEPFLLFYGF
jgi:hypothetical protein